MRLTPTRLTLAAFLFVTPTGAADVQSFTLGRVDLLVMAAARPPVTKGTIPAKTYRDLQAEVDDFLKNDVARVADRARWKVRVGEGQTASLSEIPRDTDVVTRTVQESISPRRDVVGDGLTGLLTGLAIIGVSTAVSGPPGVPAGGDSEARACVSFLETVAPKVRRFRSGLPDTADPVPAELLATWDAMSEEIRADRRCARLRGL